MNLKTLSDVKFMCWVSQGELVAKNPLANTGDVRDIGLIPGLASFHGEGNSNPLQYSLEKAMTSHSSTLAWKIPWVEEPGRLQSMGSPRVGHD